MQFFSTISAVAMLAALAAANPLPGKKPATSGDFIGIGSISAVDQTGKVLGCIDITFRADESNTSCGKFTGKASARGITITKGGETCGGEPDGGDLVLQCGNLGAQGKKTFTVTKGASAIGKQVLALGDVSAFTPEKLSGLGFGAPALSLFTGTAGGKGDTSASKVSLVWKAD